MPKFKYTAADAKGKKHIGFIEIEDSAQIYATLKAKDLYLLQVKEINKVKKNKKIKKKELSDFCRKLGTMLSSGIPLAKAMSIILQGELPKSVRHAYDELYISLKQGISLSSSMELQKNVFPELLISMCKAGEESGKLDVTSFKMAEHYEKETKLASKVKSATAYPIILLIVTGMVLITIFTFILPQFFTMFDNIKVLPLSTRIILFISNGLVKYWYYVLVVLLLIIIGLVYLLHIKSIKIKLDKLKLKIPKVGKPLKIIYTARFARTLSSLYASGLPIINALKSTRGTIGNKYIDEQFDTLINNVRNGEPLSDSLSLIEGFDAKLKSTVRIGEETGKLEDMLITIANSYEFEADEAIGRLITIIQPVLIILMAIVIGFILISVLLPILSMYENLSM